MTQYTEGKHNGFITVITWVTTWFLDVLKLHIINAWPQLLNK